MSNKRLASASVLVESIIIFRGVKISQGAIFIPCLTSFICRHEIGVRIRPSACKEALYRVFSRSFEIVFFLQYRGLTHVMNVLLIGRKCYCKVIRTVSSKLCVCERERKSYT